MSWGFRVLPRGGMERRARSWCGSLCTPTASISTHPFLPRLTLCVCHSLSNKTMLLAPSTATAPCAAWALPEPSFRGGWHTPDCLSRPGDVNQALGWGAEATPREQPCVGLAVAQGAAEEARTGGTAVHSRGEDGTASFCISQSANPPCLLPGLGPAWPGSCPGLGVSILPGAPR